MNDATHEQIREALGAYALNATESVEHRRIERHLEECDDCANEVRLLKEAAAELSWMSEPTDTTDLERRLSSNLPARRRNIRTKVLAGSAAVAVAVAGVLGAGLIQQRSVNADLTELLTTATRRVTLAPQSGFQGRGVLHVATGKAALVMDELPEAGKDRSYQLWGLTGEKPRSLAVIEGTGRVLHLFDWEGPADRFAVTIEPDGGSPVPTSDPVLLGA